MSTQGRTYWWAKDAAWWRRERIVELGEEFGPAGPCVIDWLSCEAKAQNDGGWVKSGYRSAGRGCFVDSVTVGHIVSRAVALGLLDEFTEGDGRFTCRISGWQSDQVRVEATLRKRAQRAREASEGGDDASDGHGASRDVTPRPEESRTGQDRREEEPPSIPPQGGGRKRDHARFEEQVRLYAADVFGLENDEGVRNVLGALRDGAHTTEQVRDWLTRWRPDLLGEPA